MYSGSGVDDGYDNDCDANEGGDDDNDDEDDEDREEDEDLRKQQPLSKQSLAPVSARSIVSCFPKLGRSSHDHSDLP